jgi:hypothetical protein
MQVKYTDDEIMEAAKAAQFNAIKRAMKCHYISGRRVADKWDDNRFHLSTFYSCEVKSPMKSQTNLRRRLALLPGMWSHRYSGLRASTVFRLDREICDAMAIQARHELLDEGYEDGQ